MNLTQGLTELVVLDELVLLADHEVEWRTGVGRYSGRPGARNWAIETAASAFLSPSADPPGLGDHPNARPSPHKAWSRHFERIATARGTPSTVILASRLALTDRLKSSPRVPGTSTVPNQTSFDLLTSKHYPKSSPTMPGTDTHICVSLSFTSTISASLRPPASVLPPIQHGSNSDDSDAYDYNSMAAIKLINITRHTGRSAHCRPRLPWVALLEAPLLPRLCGDDFCTPHLLYDPPLTADRAINVTLRTCRLLFTPPPPLLRVVLLGVSLPQVPLLLQPQPHLPYALVFSPFVSLYLPHNRTDGSSLACTTTQQASTLNTHLIALSFLLPALTLMLILYPQCP
ncbi:hypothetical protein GGX14DRAFT_563378 [Mycena pura]|uniref:Uncharacterized protein n=1 Tax=Mycena pura TaxID=153505 RepID=A0AAD6VKC0_9AGAR|nr:hypothetical protein GGX14DRAFT_563378 [Mycena pura]